MPMYKGKLLTTTPRPVADFPAWFQNVRDKSLPCVLRTLGAVLSREGSYHEYTYLHGAMGRRP